MEAEELRILHLEDLASDAELIQGHLRGTGLRFRSEQVSTRDAFTRALEEFHPDVVLSDYHLPGFNGLAALRLVRERDPDLPVILVTGMLGDEGAAHVMKSGANDYVLKDRLARLAPAVERAVLEAGEARARKRAEAEIRTLNADLERRVLTRTAQLRAANRAKDELIVRERAVSAELEHLRSRDAEVGLRIQQNLLLDPPPRMPGLDVAVMTVPSQKIDGDFYIFLTHPHRCLDVIVGDVMGKGIPAALLGAAAKSQLLKALSCLLAVSRSGPPPQPRDIVMLAHNELVRHLIELESFVTLCYARLDLEQGTMCVADCGHTGIVHWHAATGRCDVLHGQSLPLGIREGEIFEQVSTRFEARDVLLFFSDGITEARNAAGECFGVERLTAHLEAAFALPPDLLAESIRQEVSGFAGPRGLPDDVTCVAVRIGDPQRPHTRTELVISSDLRELRRVRALVREVCQALRDPVPSVDMVHSLELAVTEACSNIMLHAYGGRADQSVRIEAETFPEAVVIRLRHRGEEFDPGESVPGPPDTSRESGFGTYIIDRSVDRVLYYRDAGGRNCVSLVKRRDREGMRPEV